MSTTGFDLEPGLVDAAGDWPDWAALYPAPGCHPARPSDEQFADCAVRDDDDPHDDCYVCSWELCDDCVSGLPTSRQALLLHETALMIADDLTGDLADAAGVDEDDLAHVPAQQPVDLIDAHAWDGTLPQAAHEHTTVGFARRFVAAFETIAGRLAAGRGLHAANIGEEAAVHHLLTVAASLARDGLDRAVAGDELDELPATDDDEDIEFLRDVCLDDADVLLLFDPQLAGLAGPFRTSDGEAVTELHPTMWFAPPHMLAPLPRP